MFIHKKQKKIGFIILGACGYMGSNALIAFPYLFNKLRAEKINPELLCLADLQEEKFGRDILEYCNKYLNCNPSFFKEIKAALTFLNDHIQKNDEDFPIVIYDATPTNIHYDNLNELHSIKNSQIFYLSEKPLVTDPFQWIRLRYLPENFNFFCGFIETENPVFKKTKQYIIDNNLTVQKMRFWRAGSSGIKKAIGADRLGIMGGALIDKSPHDFSLAMGLLEPNLVAGWDIKDADIHQFIIDKKYFIDGVTKEFLDASNKSNRGIVLDLEKRKDLAADGLFSTSIDFWLKGKDSPINTDFLFSWIGYTGNSIEASSSEKKEEEFVDHLQQLGFNQNEWLITAEDKGPKKFSNPPYFEEDISSATHKCRIEEVRIGIITCAEKIIVCNFLSKYGQLTRYAYAVNAHGTRELIYPLTDEEKNQENERDYQKLKVRDLVNIFFAISKVGLGTGKTDYLGRKASLLIHQVMLEAHKKAIDKLSLSPSNINWFEKALPIFKDRIYSI